MKTLYKVVLAFLYFFSHLLLVIAVALSYIPCKIKHLAKPNLNKRRYMFSIYLLSRGALAIERFFKKLI